MPTPEEPTLTPFINNIFQIDDVTAGRDSAGYLFRYRGMLTAPDSAKAYDQLSEALSPYGLMPLFRKEDDGRHLILLVAAPPPPKPSNIWINILLFVLTVLSMMVAGAEIPKSVSIPEGNDLAIIALYFQYMLTGWPYALALMSILLAHELGHYFASRYHKMAATLPYFIPMPLPPVGTMGALIRLKEMPKNKRILLDVGIAGPLAGLVVAIPVLLIGLHMSPLSTHITNSPGFEGNSILYLLLKYITFGQLLPAPGHYTLPPVLHWLAFFFTGTPTPQDATDVLLGPVAWAGWIGLLVTSLNLIPVGQLDGGHILYVLLGGKRLRALLPYLTIILGILGIFSVSWWIWIALLNFFGRLTDEPRDQITELGPARRALAIFGVFVFFLVFMPSPFPFSIFSFFQP